MSEVITLDTDSESIQYLCKRDKRLAKVISMVGPISYQVHDENPYAFLVREIIEQMLSAKVGATIYKRLQALCNGTITPESITSLSDTDIKSIGTADSKVKYIRHLTSAIYSGDLSFDEIQLLSDEDVTHKLTAIRGIGIWTAKMYLLFVLDRPNILPYEDVAFLQSFEWLYKTNDRSKAFVENKCKKWAPFSSVAARYMYRALDLGLTKNEFHLYK